MRRAEKEVAVADWSEKFKTAKAVILAEYRGLKVSELTELRREIKKVHGEFKVAKNRLAKRAVTGTEWSSLEEHFRGPIGVAVTGEDPVVLTKVLTKCAESYPALKLKAGAMTGRFLEVKDIEALSKLPSKEELYAKLLGTLQGPVSRVVRTLQGVPQKLAIALKAIGEKKQ